VPNDVAFGEVLNGNDGVGHGEMGD